MNHTDTYPEKWVRVKIRNGNVRSNIQCICICDTFLTLIDFLFFYSKYIYIIYVCLYEKYIRRDMKCQSISISQSYDGRLWWPFGIKHHPIVHYSEFNFNFAVNQIRIIVNTHPITIFRCIRRIFSFQQGRRTSYI